MPESLRVRLHHLVALLLCGTIVSAAERVTRTNVLHNNGKTWKNVPLIASGLFGPVRFVPAVEIAVELRGEPASPGR